MDCDDKECVSRLGFGDSVGDRAREPLHDVSTSLLFLSSPCTHCIERVSTLTAAAPSAAAGTRTRSPSRSLRRETRSDVFVAVTPKNCRNCPRAPWRTRNRLDHVIIDPSRSVGLPRHGHDYMLASVNASLEQSCLCRVSPRLMRRPRDSPTPPTPTPATRLSTRSSGIASPSP